MEKKSGWGYYWVYDSARSNQIAEAYYFPTSRRLVVMGSNFTDVDETAIIEYPYPSDTTPSDIGKFLKERFHTEYVTFFEFGGEGVWV